MEWTGTYLESKIVNPLDDACEQLPPRSKSQAASRHTDGCRAADQRYNTLPGSCCSTTSCCRRTHPSIRLPWADGLALLLPIGGEASCCPSDHQHTAHTAAALCRLPLARAGSLTSLLSVGGEVSVLCYSPFVDKQAWSLFAHIPRASTPGQCPPGGPCLPDPGLAIGSAQDVVAGLRPARAPFRQYSGFRGSWTVWGG